MYLLYNFFENTRNQNTKTEEKPIEKIESDWKIFRINNKVIRNC